MCGHTDGGKDGRTDASSSPILQAHVSVFGSGELKLLDEKQMRKSGITFSPNITLWELSVAMETRVLISPGLKPRAAFPLTPIMLQIKFDCDLPTGPRNINV